MPDTKRSVITAVFLFLLFVLVPYLIPSFLPYELYQLFDLVSFDIAVFLRQVMVFGVIISSLTLVGGFLEPQSIYTLAFTLAKNASLMIIMIIFIGGGKIQNMGLTETTLNLDKMNIWIQIDLQVFFYIALGILILKSLESVLKWREISLPVSAENIVSNDFYITTPIKSYEPEDSSERDPERLPVPETRWELAQEETQAAHSSD
ncbi:hypothetical protein GF319_01855 [Candidatus Bathyarchaeota archaeon]|nr:hypothetical protein [Candidatus Bathyarchaeota archaeon]